MEDAGDVDIGAIHHEEEGTESKTLASRIESTATLSGLGAGAGLRTEDLGVDGRDDQRIAYYKR